MSPAERRVIESVAQALQHCGDAAREQAASVATLREELKFDDDTQELIDFELWFCPVACLAPQAASCTSDCATGQVSRPSCGPKCPT